VCGGFTQALALLARVLRDRGATTLGVEAYGHRHHRDVITAAGLRPDLVNVDEDGAVIHSLGGALLLTPAHQFPLGMPMAAHRRTEAVRWAQATGGFVIEDDYDGEFRYDRQPVGALQALDPERVVYAGTASKTLAPALRLAWLALPPSLVECVTELRRLGERQLPFTEELALAELIESGDWDRHLRRMRGRYRARRDLFTEMLAKRAPGARALGISAGLHAVVELPDGGPSEQELLERARERSMELLALGPFFHKPRRGPSALVVGYGSPPEHRYAAALRALGDVLDS
jgi:GntR family transcriptional regulator/MocR family aminotransferase